MFQFNQLSLRKISSLRCLFIYLRILLHFPFRPRSVHVLARDRGSCINKWLGQLSNFHSLAASQTFRISAGFRRKHWIKIIYLYDIWNRYIVTNFTLSFWGSVSNYRTEILFGNSVYLKLDVQSVCVSLSLECLSVDWVFFNLSKIVWDGKSILLRAD